MKTFTPSHTSYTRARLQLDFNAVSQRRLTLLATSLAQGLIMVDITIVNTALPAIQDGLRMSAGSLEWVISAYALSLAALIPIAGALGDRFGRKRAFLGGLVLFGVGSIACALSTTDAQLIGSRALQGVGGALISVLSLAILTDTYPTEERAAAIGIWAAIGGLGFGIGPVAGGLLLSLFDWPSVFWVNVPFSLAAMLLTAAAVASGDQPRVRPMDPVGATASALGLLGVTLGLIESSSNSWASWSVAAPLGTGVLLLVAFAIWESHAPSPMLPPRLLRAPSFAVTCLVFFLAYVAWEGVMFYVTLLYQNVEGWTPLRTGLSWLAMNAPFLVTAQYAGRLNRHFPSLVIVAGGCLLAGFGIAGLSAVTATSPFAWTGVCYVLAGVGYGALAPALAYVAMRRIRTDISGSASGALSASRQVGTSVGLALLGAIGVSAATRAWAARLTNLPAGLRLAAAQQSQHVATGQMKAVASALGDAYRAAAVQSFTHGYQLALLVAASCVLLAGAISAFELRHSGG
jgi:EmrB/QacA subfamily drug resistance transporter